MTDILETGTPHPSQAPGRTPRIAGKRQQFNNIIERNTKLQERQNYKFLVPTDDFCRPISPPQNAPRASSRAVGTGGLKLQFWKRWRNKKEFAGAYSKSDQIL